MKKFTFGLVFAVVLISPVAFLRAEDDATTTNPITDPIRKAEQARDRIEERRALFDEKKTELQEKFQEKRGEIRELRRENIDALIDRMIARFEQAIERLKNIHGRILARIELIEENNDEDLSDARTHLDAAMDSIEKAAETLADVPEAADDILGTTTATTTPGAFGPVRDLFGTVKEHVRAAHASLVDAITSIKGLGLIKTQAGTTTESE